MCVFEHVWVWFCGCMGVVLCVCVCGYVGVWMCMSVCSCVHASFVPLLQCTVLSNKSNMPCVVGIRLFS